MKTESRIKYGADLKQQAVKYYRENKAVVSQADVAKKFGIKNFGTLAKWVSGHDMKQARLDEPTKKQAAEMLLNGVGTAGEIAKMYNVSRMSVINWKNRYFGATNTKSLNGKTYTEAQVQTIRGRYEAQVKDSLAKAEAAMKEARDMQAKLERMTKITSLMTKKLGWTPEMVEVLGEVIAA